MSSLEKFLDAAVEIQMDPDNPDTAFIARHLVQCTLPHSNPGNVPIWRRRNGDLTLSIQPHYDSQDQAMYPYGSIPRLFLFWLVTEAKRTRTRRIKLGNSLDAFVRAIGLNSDTGNGKRGDATRLKEQINRLTRSRISFEHANEKRGAYQQMEVSTAGEFWWDVDRSVQDNLWDSWIELGEKFYEAITQSSVPVDLRALKALKRSPLALDLYSWLTLTVYQANRSKGRRTVPWHLLHGQMGAEYAELRNFKAKVNLALKKIKLVFPGLKVMDDGENLIVFPGRLPVAERPKTITGK